MSETASEQLYVRAEDLRPGDRLVRPGRVLVRVVRVAGQHGWRA
jgi:hypothetical protein